MSFLFGGRREPTKEEKFAMLEVELDASTDLFTKVMNTCMKKCVFANANNAITEGDLNKGESVCLDRCVAKFVSTQSLLQKKMNDSSSFSM